MIKQLQDRLSNVMQGGRRTVNNNFKNMSQIKCSEINAYVKPNPQVV